MAPVAKSHACAPAALNEFATGVKLEVDANFAQGAADPLAAGAAAGAARRTTREYYKGLAELRLGRPADARQTFQALAGARTRSAISSKRRRCAKPNATRRSAIRRAAMQVYERLVDDEDHGARRCADAAGRAAKAAGDTGQGGRSVRARRTTSFRSAIWRRSRAASSSTCRTSPPIAPGSNRYKLELGRAERLFGAQALRAGAPRVRERPRSWREGDDRELVQPPARRVRLLPEAAAQRARRRASRIIEKAARQGEALFFYAVAARELGDRDEYLRVVRRLVDEFPDADAGPKKR